jgi:hypothetical protein
VIPPTETLYIKKGRRYIPWGNLGDRNWHDGDPMRIGTFRLIHCPAPGHYRFLGTAKWSLVLPDQLRTKRRKQPVAA